MRIALGIAIVLAGCIAGCGGKKEEARPAAEKPAEERPAEKPSEVKAAEPPLAEKPSPGPGPDTPHVADAPEGNPPPDGKYERVVVDGVTVPMVHIMEGGTVVLVDTDGAKPRTWEEQYKRKRATKKGQLDLHKTDVNKSGKFDDDPVDREGLWLIDVKGNVTKR
ncbi:MAG TPA: hypothetical protein VNO30_08140 [Kofleriaceae bacterium]|nr:hypothetical protein [Kofleriaceae bacterium]